MERMGGFIFRFSWMILHNHRLWVRKWKDDYGYWLLVVRIGKLVLEIALEIEGD